MGFIFTNIWDQEMRNNKAVYLAIALLASSNNIAWAGDLHNLRQNKDDVETRANQKLSSLAPVDFGWHWWKVSGNEEKEGFLEGIDDCFTFNKNPKRYLVVDYFSKIRQYYNSAHSSDEHIMPVERVAEVLASNVTKNRVGEPSGRRGSLYWTNSSRERRIGFLEGFVSCGFHDKASQWSNSLAWYVSKLDIVLGHDVYDDPTNSSENDVTIYAELKELRSKIKQKGLRKADVPN